MLTTTVIDALYEMIRALQNTPIANTIITAPVESPTQPVSPSSDLAFSSEFASLFNSFQSYRFCAIAESPDENTNTSPSSGGKATVQPGTIASYPEASLPPQIESYPTPPPFSSEAYSLLLESIGKAHLDRTNAQTLSKQTLDNLLGSLLRSTESEFGFIGLIPNGKNPPHGSVNLSFLHHILPGTKTSIQHEYFSNSPSHSDQLPSSLFDSFHISYPVENSLLEITLRDKQFCISNDLASDPRATHFLPGSSGFQNYLGSPIFGANHSLIGIVGLTNRPGGFSSQVIELISPVLHTLSELIQSYSASQKHTESMQDLARLFQESLTRISDLEQLNARKQAEIDQLRLTQSKLETEMNKINDTVLLKNNYFSTMSHELRSPIQAVVGIAELLSQTSLTNPQRKYIDIIIRNGVAMTQLVSDVLDLGKLEAGKLRLENKFFCLIDCVSDVMSSFSIQAYNKNLDFAYQIDPELYHIELFGDSTRVRQILSNLISNAVKFTLKGFVHMQVNFLEFSDNREEIALRILILDSGSGIPPKNISHLFQIFYQADGSNDKIPGTGIGLFLCRQLIESMNGTIEVSSELDVGTTFTIELRLPCKPFLGIEKFPLNSALVIDSHPFTTKGLQNAIQVICHSELVSRSVSPDEFFLSSEKLSEWFLENQVVLLDSGLYDAHLDMFKSLPVGSNYLSKLILTTKVSDFAQKFDESEEPMSIVLPHVMSEIRSLIRSLLHLDQADGPAGTKQSISSSSGTILTNPKVALSESFPQSMLVVDDMATNRMIFQKLLQSIGLKVTCASSGEEALHLLAQNKFDAVLMDVCMSPMDGLECTMRWRDYEAERGLPRTLVIANTANAFPEDVQRCFDAGMDDHVSKPLTREKLQNVLQKWAK